MSLADCVAAVNVSGEGSDRQENDGCVATTPNFMR
jgi:hypothetical protein